MDELKRGIKKFIEQQFFELYGKKLIVEFVPNVIERTREIEKEERIKFTPTYFANSYTGQSIPAVGEFPYYILVKDREVTDYVRTAFHEFQHAKNFQDFLKLNNNDIESVKHSIFYKSFNLVDEFLAVQNGINNFILIIGNSSIECCDVVVECCKKDYEDFEGIEEGYSTLMHNIQYLGALFVVNQYTDKYINEIKNVKDIDLISEIIDLLCDYNNTFEWHNKFYCAVLGYCDI